MTDFTNILYLQTGTKKQCKAFNVLSNGGIMSHLKRYLPIIVGSIPIGVDIESSDIDIICQFEKKQTFEDDLEEKFGNEINFFVKQFLIQGQETISAKFELEGFTIDIFAQQIPVKEQIAYKLLIVEYQLLIDHGEPLRQYVVGQKQNGVRTEQAFCEWLSIKGNPYFELLRLNQF